ncbi:putative aspartic proteinase yapsin-3 [Clavispora lusitaniae]|uniref:Aspartic proteinase yapsin-3 n=1 Tax=Clavispora lusitaniae TaxID=36911 RepID=A0ACD0WL01_CLALS|nr:putative aspartic proteinase yapsin-3 [Clavispora lusitaniae]QFZ33675.1 putative aspartic proteinase yapsin-3 [Clavispora lusitaniae]QFZ39346.1 putative aspartic proteinase yapsin-3 [Clavispora lusitaniae]QFZ45028.1 putative aspartic proteinase yapsin-3 [Clavispora lusitaniae]QFZ50705.1 putative aspartic proteinase yapsin-3 [Clavispora lusitaniae]
MRWAILLSIASAAAQFTYRSLNKTDEVLDQTPGVSIGSQSVVVYFGLGQSALLIPPVMNGTNGGKVTRPSFNDSDYTYHNSYTDDPLFGNDKVVVNGFELQNFTFEDYNPLLQNIDMVYVGLALSNDEDEEISVLHSLQNSGYISTRSFSLFPRRSSPQYMSDALFGAVDHGRYEAPLIKFKNLGDYSYAIDDFDYPTLLMDGMSGYNFSIATQHPVKITENKWNFPRDYHDALENYFQSRYGFNITSTEVPCSIKDSVETLSFYFSGVEYRMSEADLFISIEYEGSPVCAFLGLREAFSDSFQIGRAMFRDHYMVVDYDHDEIAIAPTATKSNPATIEQIVTGIPSAIPAKYYNITTPDFYGTESAVHVTYSMYTGSQETTSSSTPTETKSGDGTKSSSSKAGGNKNAGGILVFISCALGALMMY